MPFFVLSLTVFSAIHPEYFGCFYTTGKISTLSLKHYDYIADDHLDLIDLTLSSRENENVESNY